MMSDLPHTLYDFDKKGKGEGGNGHNKPQKIDASDKAFKLQEEANRRAAARRQRQSVETSEGYTLEQLFNGEADDAPLING